MDVNLCRFIHIFCNSGDGRLYFTRSTEILMANYMACVVTLGSHRIFHCILHSSNKAGFIDLALRFAKSPTQAFIRSQIAPHACTVAPRRDPTLVVYLVDSQVCTCLSDDKRSIFRTEARIGYLSIGLISCSINFLFFPPAF